METSFGAARLAAPRACGVAAVRCATNDRGASIMIKAFAATTIAILLSGSPTSAQTVYPIDRAEILAGPQFDLKVEFDGVIAEGDARVTVNGKDHAALFGRAAQFSGARGRQVEASALILRGVTLRGAGEHHRRRHRRQGHSGR